MPSPVFKPLSRQVVVITGATSGIGFATARKFVRRGAHVLLAARSERDLRAAARTLGRRADWIVADVGEERDVRRIAERAMERFGGFDTWVNNAGVGIYGEALDVPVSDQEKLFRTNYWGVVHGATIAARFLRNRPGGGAVVTVGSMISETPAPLMASYAASKHAVKGFIDTLRMELDYARAPVSLTLIKPAAIDTPFDAHARNYMDAAARVPRPVYSPDLVADAILYAAAHKVRELTVGGAGKAMSAMANLMPGLAVKLLPAMLIPQQKDRGARRPPGDGLDSPAPDNRIYADHGAVRTFDLYTAARTHPGVTMGVLAGVGLAALMAGAARRNGANASAQSASL